MSVERDVVRRDAKLTAREFISSFRIELRSSVGRSSAKTHVAAVFRQHYGKTSSSMDFLCPADSVDCEIRVSVEYKQQSPRLLGVANDIGEKWLAIACLVRYAACLDRFQRWRAGWLEGDAFLKHPDESHKNHQDGEQQTGDVED